MTDSNQKPSKPNYISGVGRLTTDRFDFQQHINGSDFRHHADSIDLFPTLVIGGNTIGTVQDAISAINALINTATQLATATTPGAVQLSNTGDVQGTATQLRVVNIQGIPVSSLVPTTGQVLTYTGSSWIPFSGFTGSGDLSGNSTLQNVIGLTGLSNTVAMHGNSLLWDVSKTPSITQTTTSSGVAGTNFSITAQGGNNANGGGLVLQGGSTSGSHLFGGVSLKGGDSSYGLQYSTVVFGQRVLSLANPTGLTSTQMPANTGDMVIFIGDSPTLPTSGKPTGGSILYSNGGKLNVIQSDGTSFIVGQVANPNLWGIVGTLTTDSPPTIIDSEEYRWRGIYQSTASTPAILEFVGIPSSCCRVEAILIGNSSTTPGNCAAFVLTMGFTITGSGVMSDMGTETSTDPRNSGTAGGWGNPTITNAANKIRITTGSSGSETILWSVIVRIISSK